MWSSMDSGNFYGSNERKNEFKGKKIRDWDGNDCLEWASEAEDQLNIPLSSWLSISEFQRLTGRELLRFNVTDFKRIVNDMYGPMFFSLFRNLVKDRREDKVVPTTPITSMEDLEYLEERNSWITPAEELESFDGCNNWATSPAELNLTQNSCPIYNGSQSLNNNYRSQSLFLSNNYGGQSSISNDITSLHSFPAQTKKEDNFTYKVKSSILSGGSIIYDDSHHRKSTEAHKKYLNKYKNPQWNP